jgi:alpha-L-rhamnosidase
VITPYDLRCEHRVTPLGIGERRPRLAWKLRAPGRGEAQSAYRIEVAGMWDSGRVEDADARVVEYGGPPLASGTRYRWRVTVWDRHGGPAGAADSWFETGLLDPSEWSAAWIARDPTLVPIVDPPSEGDRPLDAHGLEPCPHLRRAFQVRGPVRRARAYVTARGVYELRLNGRRVGDAELAPGWTDYTRRIRYQAYDVTDHLRDGENVVAAVLADGWWSGYVGFDPRRPAMHYGRFPELLAQLHIDLEDGARQVVATDAAWRERPGRIRYADLLMGECHDARESLDGFDAPGYDDGDWRPVAVMSADRSTLVAAVDEPVRVLDELRPAAVTRRPDGELLADFGQNLVGRVRLTVSGSPPGRRIVLRHAEALRADGSLYTENLRTAEATDVFIAAGEGVEVFEPRFTFHGFRYVEVSGLEGELDVVARVLGSDTPWAGSFRCSDPEVEQLQSNIRWGQRGNFLSVPTDCPQRDERLGWLADAQVFLPTACWNADVAAFFTKWMDDVLDAQGSDGAFTNVAPRISGVPDQGAPGWGDAGVIVPWHLYRVYEDRRVLERSFDGMLAWVDHVHRNNPDLVWRHAVGPHFGDWLQVGVQTPRDVLATAFFAHSAALTARAAQVLGRDADAARCDALAARIRERFRESFVDADGRVAGGTQTGYLLALALGLLADEQVDAAVEHLAADIEARGRHLSTGFLGVGLIAPVLTDHGRADLAYALLHQAGYPSWLYSVRHGATTVWERWDGWTAERGFQAAAMNSLNHYALGSIGEWLYRDVAGISQAAGSAGFRELVVRPRMGGRLVWAEGRYESVRGLVAARWELLGGDRFVLEVEIPPGVAATVHVPTSDPPSVCEGDRPLADHEDVTVAGASDGALVCQVPAGRYRFTARLETGPGS